MSFFKADLLFLGPKLLRFFFLNPAKRQLQTLAHLRNPSSSTMVIIGCWFKLFSANCQARADLETAKEMQTTERSDAPKILMRMLSSRAMDFPLVRLDAKDRLMQEL